MRYMMLIYSQENEAATPEDMRAVAAAHSTLMDEVRSRGILRAADPLQASTTATVLRVQDGDALITDGPHAETKLWPGQPKYPLPARVLPGVSRFGPFANFLSARL
jgi:hypothetical protein